MKLSAAFAAAFLTVSVSATGWRQQPPFPCPKNIANQCTEVEQVGFDWNDLGDDDPVTEYNGYKFQGWTCGSTPGKKSRSTGTKFGSKRIGCGLSKDEFTNTISCPSKEFSVGEFEVSTDVDKVDLEIHYIMPDNRVCKKSAKCYKDGETIPNDQCGGAKAVRIKIPKASGVKKCNLFIHKIKFVCGNTTTSVPVPTTTIAPPTPTPDCGVPGKPDCATCGVSGKPDCTTDTPTPTPTLDCGIPGKADCATCGVPGKPDCTTDIPTPTPTPDCGVPGKPECGASTTDYPTTTDSPTTTPGLDCGIDSKPECTPVPTCGVDGKPECSASTTDYPTTTDSPATITPGSDCGVAGKPDCTTEVPTTTPGVDCGADGKPGCSQTTTDYPTTTPGTECGVEGKPECSSESTTTGTPGDITTTTTVLGEPSTSSPVADCQQNPSAKGCAPTTTPPGNTDTPSCGAQSEPECQGTTDAPVTTTPPAVITTTLPPVVTTYVLPPPPPTSCPDLVPKCLKTWIFKTSCTDTADVACFCPQPGFIEEVAGCIQAWGQSDSEVATGLSYLLGLCGEYISKNPTVVTCIPDTITLSPPVDPRTETLVTQAPIPTQTIIVTNDVTETITITPTPYAPAPPPGITIIATITKTEECSPFTITEGPDVGKVVTETTVVKERTINIPNVELIVTKSDDDVEIVYPPQVSTIYQPGPTVYPVPKTTPVNDYVPTTLLTKTPSGLNQSQPTMPVQYDGAAASSKGPVALAGMIGGILVVILM
ncbi:hypothetical protein EV426DRAFT_218089 [Tirmania nivea]|nr:hypothetical protein EV426DRAFT_218089 [Tirmania nivea]